MKRLMKDDPFGIALLTRAELAEELGVSPLTLSRWVREGRFPKAIRISDTGSKRWRVKDVQDWLRKKQRRVRRRDHPGWRNLEKGRNRIKRERRDG